MVLLVFGVHSMKYKIGAMSELEPASIVQGIKRFILPEPALDAFCLTKTSLKFFLCRLPSLEYLPGNLQ